MWEKVDKTKLVQYKLKVDLNGDVLKVIEQASAGQKPNMQKDTYNQLTGAVKDKMLVDHRDKQAEETKEKPDVQRFQKPAIGITNRSGASGYAGARMEDIKEQDSEAEVANSSVALGQKDQAPGGTSAKSKLPTFG